MSLLTSFTRPTGQGQRPFLQTWDPSMVSWGSAVITANTAYLRYVGRLDKPMLISTFQLNITVSAGNLDIGLYAIDAAGAYSLVGSLGSTASPGTGTRTFSPTPFWAPAGSDIALSIVGDDATLSLPRFANPSATLAAYKNQACAKATAGVPLPASIAAAPGGSTYVPYILAY